jgi:hypothetical protein
VGEPFALRCLQKQNKFAINRLTAMGLRVIEMRYVS